MRKYENASKIVKNNPMPKKAKKPMTFHDLLMATAKELRDTKFMLRDGTTQG